MLRRQFYFALAVHERCQQLRSLSKVMAAEKGLLLTSARRGGVLLSAMLSSPINALISTYTMGLQPEKDKNFVIQRVVCKFGMPLACKSVLTCHGVNHLALEFL